jgi:hypothetical protein
MVDKKVGEQTVSGRCNTTATKTRTLTAPSVRARLTFGGLTVALQATGKFGQRGLGLFHLLRGGKAEVREQVMSMCVGAPESA